MQARFALFRIKVSNVNMIREEIYVVKSTQRRMARHADPPICPSLSLGIIAAATGLITLVVGFIVGLICIPVAANAASGSHRELAAAAGKVVQDEDQGDETDVSTADINKYVAVYKAMQRDRSMTAEQAAIGQGMTLKSFRDLENRIEGDEAAREQAREKLRAAASPAPSASGSPAP